MTRGRTPTTGAYQSWLVQSEWSGARLYYVRWLLKEGCFPCQNLVDDGSERSNVDYCGVCSQDAEILRQEIEDLGSHGKCCTDPGVEG